MIDGMRPSFAKRMTVPLLNPRAFPNFDDVNITLSLSEAALELT